MGMGIGAAMTGLRPIIEGMNMGFLLLAYNQISNNAGMLHYTSGGQYKVKMGCFLLEIMCTRKQRRKCSFVTVSSSCKPLQFNIRITSYVCSCNSTFALHLVSMLHLLSAAH